MSVGAVCGGHVSVVFLRMAYRRGNVTIFRCVSFVVSSVVMAVTPIYLSPCLKTVFAWNFSKNIYQTDLDP